MTKDDIIVVETPKINLRKEHKSSGLSLSSIKKKKDHLIKQMEVVLEKEDQPHDEFKEEDMISEWNTFIQNLEKKKDSITLLLY